jgi:hydrogenase nickel incorporation protein HypA/HybF
MHEMSLAESVLQIIEEAAREQGFNRVRTVVLEIGQLAAVEAEAMRFCFDAVVQGSVAEGAALEIMEVAGTGWCEQCATTVTMPELIAVCPLCGGAPLQPNGGAKMRVKDLEVE